MKMPLRRLLGVFLLGALAGCTTFQTLDLKYTPGSIPLSDQPTVKVAVLPFENATWNGQENPYWIGQANLLGLKLFAPTNVSYLVTQGVKREMAAYGYQLSQDEIYTIQINRNDLRTLLRRIPHIQVDFLIGGVINHFFVQQTARFIGEVEIEAYLVRPPFGDIVWNKKVGHREVRIAFSPEDFSTQCQEILNKLLDKTLKDLFRHSDFRLQVMSGKK